MPRIKSQISKNGQLSIDASAGRASGILKRVATTAKPSAVSTRTIGLTQAFLWPRSRVQVNAKRGAPAKGGPGSLVGSKAPSGGVVRDDT